MKLTETCAWNNAHSTNDVVGSLTATSLTATPKSFEEEMAEEYNVQKVVDYLEKHGIQVKTEYGYYRNTYSILKDIGERWEQLKV